MWGLWMLLLACRQSTSCLAADFGPECGHFLKSQWLALFYLYKLPLEMRTPRYSVLRAAPCVHYTTLYKLPDNPDISISCQKMAAPWFALLPLTSDRNSTEFGECHKSSILRVLKVSLTWERARTVPFRIAFRSGAWVEYSSEPPLPLQVRLILIFFMHTRWLLYRTGI